MKLNQLFGIKKTRNSLLILLIILLSVMLSGCGGQLVNGWPGLSVNQDVVYLSYNGAVYAVNAQTGNLIWQFPKDKPDASKPFFAAPAFGPDGMVVVGNFGKTLYALDPNGAIQWQFVVESGNFVGPALVVDTMVLAPCSDDFLYALDLNGNLVWKFKTENMLWGQPASDGQLVYLPGMDHTLYALNLKTGTEAWRKDLGSALLSGPVLLEDGKLFISNLEGEVVAFDLSSQRILWRTPTGGQIWSSPVLHEGVLFIGNDKNMVTAISASDGTIVWQQDAGSPVIGGAAILTDGVAFPTEGGNLIAWDLKGEKQQWTKLIGGKLYTTPVVAGDRLVTAVTEGDKLLQAFTLTGQESWAFTLPK